MSVDKPTLNQTNDSLQFVSFHRKTVAYFVVGLIVIIAIFLTIVRFVWLEGLTRLEEDALRQSSSQAQGIINNLMTQQSNASYDWSYWDETEQYILHSDGAYFERNLGNETFNILSLDAMIFLDKAGNVIDFSARDESGINKSLVNQLLSYKNINRYLNKPMASDKEGDESLYGLISFNKGIFIVSFSPVRNSEATSDQVGWLVWVQNLSNRFPEEYQSLLTGDSKVVMPEKTSSATKQTIVKNSEDMSIALPLTDVDGHYIGDLKTQLTRKYYLQGERIFFYIASFIVISGILVTFLFKYLLSKNVGRKLLEFEQGINGLIANYAADSNANSAGIIDWLKRMAESGNKANNDLAALMQKFNAIYQSNHFGILLIVDGIVIDVNEFLLNTLDYSKGDVIGYGVDKLCRSEANGPCGKEILEKYLAEGQHSFEATMNSREGDAVDCFIEAKVIEEDSKTAVLLSIKDITHQKKQAKLIEELIQTDHASGFLNRATVSEELDNTLVQLNSTLAFAYLSIDKLGQIGDIYGEKIYSDTVAKLAESMKNIYGSDMLFGRLSDHEFIVISSAPDAKQRLKEKSNHLLKICRTAIELYDIHIKIDVKAVVASSDLQLGTFESYLQAVIFTCHEKRTTADNFVVEMDDSLASKATLAIGISRDFLCALQSGQIRAYYQPMIEASTGKIVGFEALARWEHPKFGMISPEVFISLAEQRSLIIELGEQILQQACEFLASVNASQGPHCELSVHVNLSSPHFHYHRLTETIARLLDEYDIRPCQLVFELTESILIRSESDAIEQMHSIQQLGTKLALDDFGTGYSSFSVLCDFPFDIVKLDRSYIEPISNNPRAEAMVRNILNMSQEIGLKTVAEGVETNKQFVQLQAWGIDEIQGYYFYEAKPPETALALLDKEKKGRFD
ncbi:EAL domain-containing protein [Vibrio sp.]|nr:EAL domain-containing protein [Vibrio sp.]